MRVNTLDVIIFYIFLREREFCKIILAPFNLEDKNVISFTLNLPLFKQRFSIRTYFIINIDEPSYILVKPLLFVIKLYFYFLLIQINFQKFQFINQNLYLSHSVSSKINQNGKKKMFLRFRSFEIFFFLKKMKIQKCHEKLKKKMKMRLPPHLILTVSPQSMHDIMSVTGKNMYIFTKEG